MSEDVIEALARAYLAAEQRATEAEAKFAWMKSPSESCLAERADGNGGCGECAVCCKEMREQRDAAEQWALEAERDRDEWKRAAEVARSDATMMLNASTEAEQRATEAERAYEDCQLELHRVAKEYGARADAAESDRAALWARVEALEGLAREAIDALEAYSNADRRRVRRAAIRSAKAFAALRAALPPQAGEGETR